MYRNRGTDVCGDWHRPGAAAVCDPRGSDDAPGATRAKSQLYVRGAEARLAAAAL